jgi:hypothetical protein
MRQSPVLHFTKRKVVRRLYAGVARHQLGLPRGDDGNLTPIFTKAAGGLNKRLKTFSVLVPDQDWRRGGTQVAIELVGEAEWTDAVLEAWKGVDSRNPNHLSDAGQRLFELAQTGFEPGFTDARTLAFQIGVAGRENEFEDYLWEVSSKAKIPLRWESTGTRYGENLRFRIWLNEKAESGNGTGLNPKLEVNFSDLKKDDLDGVRKLMHELIVRAEPQGNTPLSVFRISTHQELKQCFRGEPRGDTMARFFDAVTLNKSVKRFYDFRDRAPCWSVTLLPERAWETSVEAIRQELAQPSLEERFGLSAEAAKLLAWIEKLPSEQMLGCYSPVVEDARQRWIGISSPWEDANFAAYLQMLLDEINEKTEYNLKVQSWHHYSSTKSRIRVDRKRPVMDDVIKQLQWNAWRQGVSLDPVRIQQILEQLVAGKI